MGIPPSPNCSWVQRSADPPFCRAKPPLAYSLGEPAMLIVRQLFAGDRFAWKHERRGPTIGAALASCPPADDRYAGQTNPSRNGKGVRAESADGRSKFGSNRRLRVVTAAAIPIELLQRAATVSVATAAILVELFDRAAAVVVAAAIVLVEGLDREVRGGR